MDRKGEVTLIVHKVRSKKDQYLWEVASAEWLPGELRKDIGEYFVHRPFFQVSREQFDEACRIIDRHILENCSKDELERYEKQDVLPEGLEKNVPQMLRPFWNVLVMVNQNKRCMYKVLKAPLPDYPNINVSLWSGHKVIGPFTSDMDNYYNTLRVVGSPNDIDKFLRKYKV